MAARWKTIDDGGILTASKPSNPPTLLGLLSFIWRGEWNLSFVDYCRSLVVSTSGSSL